MKNRNIYIEQEKFRVLIVDDELLACKLLSEYVAQFSYLELVGCCTNAVETFTIIQNQHIDILFTDIQMPNISGIELASNLVDIPAIIFTTAYSEYAMEGYEIGVVDYLLKPIAFPRFLQALNKAIQRVEAYRNSIQDSSTQPVSSIKTFENRDYIVIKADSKLYKINYNDLIYVEGQSEYVTFHTTQRNITAYYTLKKLVEQLPKSYFVRIHKSYIVSIRHIDIVENNSVQIGKLRLPIGASFKDEVMHLLI